MTSVSFPLIPGQPDVQFRFTIKTARELDRASQYGIQVLLKNGQTTDAIVLMTCYGMKHDHPRMTESKAEELIQQFVDPEGNNGDATELFSALFKALSASGVFGKAAGDEANPTSTPTSQTAVTTA